MMRVNVAVLEYARSDQMSLHSYVHHIVHQLRKHQKKVMEHLSLSLQIQVMVHQKDVQ